MTFHHFLAGDDGHVVGGAMALVRDVAVGAGAIAAPLAIPHWLAISNAWLLAAMPALGVLYIGYGILGRRSRWRYWERARRRDANDGREE